MPSGSFERTPISLVPWNYASWPPREGLAPVFVRVVLVCFRGEGEKNEGGRGKEKKIKKKNKKKKRKKKKTQTEREERDDDDDDV